MLTGTPPICILLVSGSHRRRSWKEITCLPASGPIEIYVLVPLNTPKTQIIFCLQETKQETVRNGIYKQTNKNIKQERETKGSWGTVANKWFWGRLTSTEVDSEIGANLSSGCTMGRGCVFPYVDGRRVSGNEICQKVLFVSLPFMSDQSSGREKSPVLKVTTTWERILPWWQKRDVLKCKCGVSHTLSCNER